MAVLIICLINNLYHSGTARPILIDTILYTSLNAWNNSEECIRLSILFSPNTIRLK